MESTETVISPKPNSCPIELCLEFLKGLYVRQVSSDARGVDRLPDLLCARGEHLPLVVIESGAARMPGQTNEVHHPPHGLLWIADHFLVLDVENRKRKDLLPVGHQSLILHIEAAQPAQIG